MAEKAFALELLAPPPCPLPAAFCLSFACRVVVAPVVRCCMHRRHHSIAQAADTTRDPTRTWLRFSSLISLQVLGP